MGKNKDQSDRERRGTQAGTHEVKGKLRRENAEIFIRTNKDAKRNIQKNIFFPSTPLLTY